VKVRISGKCTVAPGDLYAENPLVDGNGERKYANRGNLTSLGSITLPHKDRHYLPGTGSVVVLIGRPGRGLFLTPPPPLLLGGRPPLVGDTPVLLLPPLPLVFLGALLLPPPILIGLPCCVEPPPLLCGGSKLPRPPSFLPPLLLVFLPALLLVFLLPLFPVFLLPLVVVSANVTTDQAPNTIKANRTLLLFMDCSPTEQMDFVLLQPAHLWTE